MKTLTQAVRWAAALAAFALLLLTTPGYAATGDENWDNRFGVPGVDGQVNAIAVAANGDVYAGGNFSNAGGIPAKNIARFDGRRWYALGAGVNDEVTALAIDGSTVYAAGRFTVAGSATAKYIAKWNGTAWSAVGAGVGPVEIYYGSPQPGRVNALLVNGGSLYVGGRFNKMDAVAANHIARWNGTAWSALGTGMGQYDWENNFDPTGEVFALANNGSTIYAGGEFLLAGNVTVNSVAAWNGSAWSALGGGILKEDDGTGIPPLGIVSALAYGNGKLYAGGMFAYAGGNSAENLAAWNGSAWSALGAGARAEQYAIDPAVRALAVSGTTLYVGGEFEAIDNQDISLVARLSGSTWSAVGTGITDDGYDEVRAFAVAPDGSLYMGGSFRITGEQKVDNIARWATNAWSTLGKGPLFIGYGTDPAKVLAIAAANDGQAFVGGQFAFAGGVAVGNLAHFDGTRWNNIGGTTDRVRALALTGDYLYVGGEFTQIGGISANHIARWNRTTHQWEALGSGINGDVYALAYANGRLYAGGGFNAAGGVVAQDVAYWDGTWHPFGTQARIFEVGNQGTEVGTFVNTLLVTGNRVFIGGHFQTIQYGTNTADLSSFVVVRSLVEWNSANDTWARVGDAAFPGVSNNGYYDFTLDVNGLALIGNSLFIGGEFNQAGTSPATGIARWNIVSNGWENINGGLGGLNDTKVFGIAALGTDLFVAGHFTTAGSTSARFAARYDTQTSSWQGLGSGLKWYNDLYTEADTVATSTAGVYFGGLFDNAGGNSASGFARWGGATAGNPPPPPPDLHFKVFVPMVKR